MIKNVKFIQYNLRKKYVLENLEKEKGSMKNLGFSPCT